MGMTRQERIALHKKQERLQVKDGAPLVADLKEGVVEYIKHNGVLHKKVLDKG